MAQNKPTPNSLPLSSAQPASAGLLDQATVKPVKTGYKNTQKLIPCLRVLCITLCLLLPSSCVERPDSPDQHRDEPTTQPAGPRVVDFIPGVRIDYRVPQVEIDAEVILRMGQLELFAYSRAPTPKEHETILLLRVPPEAIYQALGLIGLTPGRPPSYLPETQTNRPATGDPVDVLLRRTVNGKAQEVSACEWMLDLKTRQPMAKTHWLFTGSRRLPDGTFCADIDGTVVTVVDFASALLTLPAAHSAANEQLWLAANTEAIPPIGTKVTLILRPTDKPQDIAQE